MRGGGGRGGHHARGADAGGGQGKGCEVYDGVVSSEGSCKRSSFLSPLLFTPFCSALLFLRRDRPHPTTTTHKHFLSAWGRAGDPSPPPPTCPPPLLLHRGELEDVKQAHKDLKEELVKVKEAAVASETLFEERGARLASLEVFEKVCTYE